MNLLPVILPELILVVAACALFLIGVINKPAARHLSAALAAATLLGVFILQLLSGSTGKSQVQAVDALHNFHVGSFAQYIKLLTAGVGFIFALMAWPSNRTATGNGSLQFDTEGGEFFALLLLSIAGVFVGAGANDIILLFLGIELASIPTYIMVSISRPLPEAQEAGVKYFFLGAMAAALMLFGFSYLYGTTGLTRLDQIGAHFAATVNNDTGLVQFTGYQTLAVVVLIAGFSFKMAAVPLHLYAADVYQGAATPVTAMLSFIPKCSGLVAIIKILYAVGGGFGASWALPIPIVKLIWIIAVLSMCVGNVLGLLQQNVKRTLAYSSVAHSGYLLVGVATLISVASNTHSSTPGATQLDAIRSILFYLTAYGVMNSAAFGVLMMLPAKPLPAWDRRPTTGSAETFDDIAGAGIARPGLGLAMAVCCFSLTGLPLTIGFFGKYYLIRPALDAGNYWLVGLMMLNAAISAAYYLRIVGTMFLKPELIGGLEPAVIEGQVTPELPRSIPLLAAVALSVGGTLIFGTLLPATDSLVGSINVATTIDRTLATPGMMGPGGGSSHPRGSRSSQSTPSGKPTQSR